MCGVAAIFAYDPNTPFLEREQLTRMTDTMVSRGPDGQGFWMSDCGRVGFGHIRIKLSNFLYSFPNLRDNAEIMFY